MTPPFLLAFPGPLLGFDTPEPAGEAPVTLEVPLVPAVVDPD